MMLMRAMIRAARLGAGPARTPRPLRFTTPITLASCVLYESNIFQSIPTLGTLVPSMYPWMKISVKLLLVLLNRAKYMFTH